MEHAQKILLARLVAQVLITDAVLTDAEEAFLGRFMAHLGLSAADAREVTRRVNIGAPVGPLVEQISPEHRQALLRAMREAASSDGETSAREEALIDAVVEALAH